MGKPGGSVQDIRRDADRAAAELLASIADARRQENIAASVAVSRVQQLGEIRFASEMAVFESGDRDMDPDVALARRTAECEAAVALSLSKRATRDMVTVGDHLAYRLPRAAAAFAAGDLDYPRVKTIVLVLERASDETVAALEADAVAAALRLSPRGLKSALWSAWMRHDRAEAQDAREKAQREERSVHVRLGENGIARLTASITAVEGAECDAILDELVATVCPQDPRTTRQLRGYALMALVHREDSIACRCRGGDKCPVAGAAATRPRRRVPLVQLMIDIKTLLGLTAEPATLADGTPIDPEVARALARDAQWQGLLTELLGVAEELQADAGSSGDAAATATATATATAGAAAPAAATAPHPSGPSSVMGTAEPRVHNLLYRSRSRAAGVIPDPSVPATPSSPIGEQTAHGAIVAEFLSAIESDPELGRGIHPDGHGGLVEPSAGALTYRPGRALVAMVRATYATCTFHGCSVPSSKCEIDHIVPFDHADPRSGGWTIHANLHPVCTFHHQAKTLKLWRCAKLAGGAMYWRSSSGLERVTLPSRGILFVPDEYHHRVTPRKDGPAAQGPDMFVDDSMWPRGGMPMPAPDNPTIRTEEEEAEYLDFLYQPTWWEANITTDAAHRSYAPTLSDLARITDPQERVDATYLRDRYLEHLQVVAVREERRPPPF